MRVHGHVPVRVLMIEDQAGDAGSIRAMLESAAGGFEVAAERNLARGRSLAREAGWDVILLGIALPDSQGAAAVREVALAAPRTPIVVLAGRAAEALAAQSLRYGAQDHLAKGALQGAQLVRSIRYAIERKHHENALADSVRFDPLTRLVSRSLFLDRLEHALACAARRRRRVGLMFIDVDGFQAVSQRMGREARESVLRALAGSLGRLARRADTVARLGGDEFVMLLEGVHGHTDLAAAAGRVLRALRRPLPVAGSDLPVPVACSVAIALFPDDPPDAASLARNADHNPSFCRGDRSL